MHFIKLIQRQSRSQKGFTLIELIVVIAIIAILATIGVTVYSGSQQRARDARRRGDMRAMQNAFEQYYAENGGYAADCSTMAANLQGGILPTAPAPFGYSLDCDTVAHYCLCTELEQAGSGNASDFSCTFAADSDFYCVESLQ